MGGWLAVNLQSLEPSAKGRIGREWVERIAIHQHANDRIDRRISDHGMLLNEKAKKPPKLLLVFDPGEQKRIYTPSFAS